LNASRSFNALIGTALAVAAVLVVAFRYIDTGVDAAHIRVLCGSVITTVTSPDAGTDVRLAVLRILAVAMAAAGALALGLTLWRTRTLVGALTRHEVTPPVPVAEAASELGLTGKVVVAPSSSLFSFCFGIIRPKVCVSTALVEALTPNELRAVLAHERYHLRRRDPLRILLANMLAAASFPVPLGLALRRVYLVAREIDADQDAIRCAGRNTLARAIYKVLAHPRTLQVGEVSAVGAINGQRARIDHLIDPRVSRYPGVGLRPLLLSLTTAAVLLFVTLAPWHDVGHAAAADDRQRQVVQQVPGAPILCDALWDECRASGCGHDCAAGPAADSCPHDEHRLLTEHGAAASETNSEP
jgi:Zn-dependent protease with chaperone function